MKLLCKIYDVTSTQDNPIPPVDMVVDSDKVSEFIHEKVDKDHIVVVSFIPTYS